MTTTATKAKTTKITIKRDTIANTLVSLSKVIPKQTLIPILECFLFEIDGTDVSVTVSNQESEVIATFTADKSDAENFSFCVPAKIFAETIKKLTSDFIEMNINDKQLVLTSNKSKYKFILVNGPKLFPRMNIESINEYVKLPGNLFRTAISSAAKFCNPESAKEQIRSIMVKSERGKMTVVGTDSFAMDKITVVLPDSMQTIPKSSVSVGTCKTIGDTLVPSSELEVGCNEKFLHIKGMNIEVKSRLADNKFPDIDYLFNARPENKAEINREDMMKSLDRLTYFNSNGIIKVVFSKESIIMSGEDLIANKGHEEIECVSDLEIDGGFNLKVLLMPLECFEAPKLFIYGSAPNKPFFLSANLPEDTQGLYHQFLLMPMVTI